MESLYKYKSSKFATYSQYFATPVVIGVFLFQVYYFFIAGNSIDEESLFFIPFWLWASMTVIINFIKLRYVEVREDNILMKTMLGVEKILNYKDIVWINQNIFGSNWYIISIKYRNSETGKLKVIFVLPEQYTRREGWKVVNIFQELNVTKYIREQIIKSNSSYNSENEPSRWYLFVWMFLTLIPFILVSFLLII